MHCWMIHRIKIFCLLLLLSACSKKEVVNSEQELRQYVLDDENGLWQIKDIEQLKISLRYRPQDLLVLQEIDDEKFDENTVQEKKNKYGQYQYFVLSFSQDEQGMLYAQKNQKDFSSVLQILSFRLGEFVYGVVDGEEIPLADYQFSRLYNKSGETSVLIAFENKVKEDNELKIVVDEFGLGVGRQEFVVKGTDIAAVPRLNFENILM